jgi:hypothetical protein
LISKQRGQGGLHVLPRLAYLVGEVNVTQRGLFVGENFEQDIFSQKLVRSSDCVIPRIKDVPGPVLLEFGVAQLGCRLAVLRR